MDGGDNEVLLIVRERKAKKQNKAKRGIIFSRSQQVALQRRVVRASERSSARVGDAKVYTEALLKKKTRSGARVCQNPMARGGAQLLCALASRCHYTAAARVKGLASFTKAAAMAPLSSGGAALFDNCSHL